MNWKPVVGYEEQYEVSDCGDVRRIGRDAIGRARYKNHILARHLVRGYVHCILHRRGSKPKNCLAHVLVAEAFIGPRPEGKVINHKNGNKADPSLTNLEYVTPSENHKHAIATGLFKPPSGERHWSAILPDEQILEIIRRVNSGERNKDLAKEFGIRANNVSRYKTGARRSVNA